MSDPDQLVAAALRDVPGLAGRLTRSRTSGGIASILLESTGLSARERNDLEARIRSALGQVPDLTEIRIAHSSEKVGRTIIAVASGKGGVGKSTVAANLAVALARVGRKVGLVDADIYGPSQPHILGRHERPELVDKQIVPVSAHGIRMLSIGQLIEPGTAVAWRGPMTASALGNLMDGDWGDCEYLIVDLPPGTGDVQMTLMQKWRPAGAVIVSTPQDLALIDASRAIDMFRKMHVEVVGLIENMSGYLCPHCGERSDPFGAGGAEAAAEAMAIPFLGRIPLRASIREASDSGAPPAAGEGEEADIFRSLAVKLVGQIETRGSLDATQR